jgi:UDP-N-acetylglucosamine acyltransferase
VAAPADIHPTALVDPRAQLGPGVRVGAYTVIGGEVVMEADAEIGHHAVLEGPVTVGARARIGHGCVLGGVPQDFKFKPGTHSGVRIGADAILREYVTIHRATREGAWTEIGEGCFIMGMSHVAHDCRLGQGVVVINYAGLTGHVQVGDRATIGGLTGVAPFSRIGSFAYVGGCSKITSDIPPYMLVDGAPATARGVNVIGLRRGGMSAADRRLVQEAYRLLYRSGLAPARAVEAIRTKLPATPALTHLVEFIDASRRGICAGAGRQSTTPEAADSEPVF